MTKKHVILASDQPQLGNNASIELARCNSCKNEFATYASIEPYCPFCGSDHTTMQERSSVEMFSVENDAELSEVKCPECGTHNIMHNETASYLRGEMHCVVCGTHLEYLADDEFNPAIEPGDEIVKVEDFVASSTELENIASEDDDENDDLGGDQIEKDDGGSSLEVMSVNDLVQGDGYTVARALGNLYAFKSQIPVAVLSQVDVSPENRDLFITEKYEQIVSSALNNGSTLKDFNFREIQFDGINVEKSKIEAAVNAEKQKNQAEIDDFVDSMDQALAIAATGLSKGFFKGRTHKFRDAIVSELQSITGDSQLIASRIIAKASDDYNSSLIELAKNIIAKPLEIRNHMADAIMQTEFVMPDSQQTASVISIGDRLERAALVTANTHTKDTAPNAIQQLKSLSNRF